MHVELVEIVHSVYKKMLKIDAINKGTNKKVICDFICAPENTIWFMKLLTKSITVTNFSQKGM